MPDQKEPSPSPSSEASQGLPEVNLPAHSIQDYEVITMEKDLAAAKRSEEEKRVFAKPKSKEDSDVLKASPTPQPPPPLPYDEGKYSYFSFSYFLIGFFVVLFLGGGGLAFYWYWGSKGAVVSSPLVEPAPPLKPTPSLDSPLIAINKTLRLEVKEGQTRQEFFSTLKGAIIEVSKQANEGDLVRVYLYQDGKKLSFSQLTTLLAISLPSLERYLQPDSYTLLYQQGRGDQHSFGLVAKGTIPQSLQDALPLLETEASLLLNSRYQEYALRALPQASSETFLDNNYQEIKIRYLNFPSPDLTFDYALYNELFLLAGSRQMMFTLIDRAKLLPLPEENKEEAAP